MGSNGQFNFDSLKIDDATSRIDLDPWLGPGSHLIVRPSGEANRAYFSEAFLIASARARTSVAKRIAALGDEEERAKDRAEDVELFAKHVVVGGLARSSSGEMVPVTPENALALLKAIVGPLPWLFERIRNHCGNYDNFHGLPSRVDVDTVALAKN